MLRTSYRLLFFLLLISALFVFGRKGGHEISGGLVQLAVRCSLKSQLTYRSVEWKKGELVFEDPLLFDLEKRIYVQAERAAFTFSFDRFPVSLGLSIHVEKPHVTLLGLPTAFSIRPSHWLDLRLKIEQGIIEWPSMGLHAKAHFEKISPQQLGHLILEMGPSRIEMEAFSLGQETQFEALFSKVESSLLQPWIQWMGYDFFLQEGILEGGLHLQAQNGKWTQGSLHSEGRGILVSGGFGTMKGDSLSLDWEGEWKNRECPLLGQPLPVGRIRFACEGGCIQKEGKGIQEIQGSLFYDSDLGIRWEWAGLEENLPLSFKGKGFWPSSRDPWLDAELSLPKGQGFMKAEYLEDESRWEIELSDLEPSSIQFIQSWITVPFPFLKSWIWKEGTVSCKGTGILSHHWNLEYFQAKNLVFSHKEKPETELSCSLFSAQLTSQEWKGAFSFEDLTSGYPLPACSGAGWIRLLQEPAQAWNWAVEASLEEGKISLPWGMNLEQVRGRLIVTPSEWAIEEASADLKIGSQNLRLESTLLTSHEEALFFDIRLRRGFWDLARLVGVEKKGIFSFDPQKSEWLGAPLLIEECYCLDSGLKKLQLELDLPWNSVLSLASWLQEEGVFPSCPSMPLSGSAKIRLFYTDQDRMEIHLTGLNLLWKETPFPFHLQATRKGDIWHFEEVQCGLLGLNFLLGLENQWWVLKEGKGVFAKQAAFSFHGRSDSHGHGQINLEAFDVETAPLVPFFDLPPEISGGEIKGQGCITFDLPNFEVEADFDLASIRLETDLFHLENRGPVHAFYSPTKGVGFQGVDCHLDFQNHLAIDCRIGLIQYDQLASSWSFNHAHFHLPGTFFSSFLKKIPFEHDVDFTADFTCASDFSTFSCFLKEGFLPFGGLHRHIQELNLHFDEKHLLSNFFTFHQSHCLKVDLQMDRSAPFSGQLILEDIEHPLNEGERPLIIQWIYDQKGLTIHSIEGNFGGIEASFHSEWIDSQSHLIGSARLDFHLLSEILPPSVAEVFTELEMGKGYELKGRLAIDRKDLSQIFFQGILSGKQLELFGYQLRTLLAQVDLSPSKIKIYDLKASDSAGILKIEEILLEQKEKEPWTLSIPLLTMTELRPSLLQKPGGPPGEISPLVVRDLKIHDLRGILEDGNTYTAHGELHFINSYKRGHTVFDLPSDVLGRIIGLDMELLIPVCGTVRYNLKEGAFHLQELEEAYSEGRRSEFFLIQTADSPLMDLDGNLQIHVKMKQYVLFKLTEAFIISIDGKLNDPHYHLQKKKKFLYKS